MKSIFTDLLRTLPHPSKFLVTAVKIEENIKVPQEMTKISIQIKVIFIILNITILYKIFILITKFHDKKLIQLFHH